MRRPWNWCYLLCVAALTVAADRISKRLIVNNLEIYRTWDPPIPFLKSIFSFTHTTNTGAAFGLFPDQGILFIIVALVVITAIIFYYSRMPDGFWLVRAGLGLQLGGVLGNLADRLNQGYVTDFIDLNFWPLKNWAVFNLADSAIVVGVGLLAITMLREDLDEREPESAIQENEAAGETEPSLR